MKRYDNITPSELHDLLWAFNKQVQDKDYEKMPYEVWRKLSNLAESNESVVARWDAHSVILECPSEGFIDEFWFTDASFGSFLFAEYIPYVDWPSDYWKLNSSDTLATNSSIYFTDPTVYDEKEVQNNFSKPQEQYSKYIKNEENKDMKTPFNFDFGPVNANTVRMSMYGLAVKNKSGTWVSYNSASDEIMDVEIFNFDGAQFLYKMPVAISAVKSGDVVVHAGVPMFVEQVLDKTLYAIDPVYGEKKEILLTKSPFGFNFVTKVVNFLDGFMGGATPDAENPFGNMWMLMALNGDNGLDPQTIALMAMANGSNGMNTQMLMPLLLAQNGKSNDMLPMLMAVQVMGQANTCSCGCGAHQ